MKNGSVVALSNKVTTMTLAASRIESSRPGKGAPVAVVSGIDSAAARVTAPRTPAQPTIKTLRGRYGPSRSRIRFDSRKGR